MFRFCIQPSFYKRLNAKDCREILYILRNNQLMEMLSCGNCKEKV